MNLHTVNEFRHGMYGCFKRAGDALFNTMDALSSETAAHRFPELSLSPFFQRRWPSLYEAFEDGHIDAEQLREIVMQCAPLPDAGQHVFLGIETSNLLRPDAQTEEDRTVVPLANLPANAHVVCPGWVISSVVLLPTEAGQGTVVLDGVRVTSAGLATEVAASQRQAVVDWVVKRGLRPVITSRSCCGMSHACGPQHKPSAGRRSWLVRTTSWSWLVLWLWGSLNLGRRAEQN